MPEDYIDEKGRLDKERLNSVLTKRYEDTTGPESFVTEQDGWENNQIASAILNVGAKDRVKANQFEDFEYVFDEEQRVDFIKATVADKLLDENLDEPKISERQKKGKNDLNSAFISTISTSNGYARST